MKFLRILLMVTALYLFLPRLAFAHSVGQPPFLKVDGQYAGFYSVPLSSPFFNLPQDDAPQTQLVNQPIQFEIDIAPLGVPIYVAQHARFTWDFGDGTAFEGLKTTHTYTKPGPYIITINAAYGETPPQLIELLHVNVLPNPQYQLPVAVMTVNGQTVTDPLTTSPNVPLKQSVHFDATKSTGVGPLKYIWDFSDNASSSASIADHTYGAMGQTTFPVLRVIDANGFYADAYAQLIDGTQLMASATPSASTAPLVRPQPPTQTSRLFKSLFAKIFETPTANPLLFLFVVALVFIAGGLHAMTPGHGKSIIAAFLVGKKGSKIPDVLLLAFSLTLTHTIVVFVLGFIFLWIDQYHTLTDVLPYFEKAGALVVIVLALRLIFSGYKHLRHQYQHAHHHDHHHDHDHGHTHTAALGKRSLLLAGFSGGIVPCTDAFALLLLFASEGKVALGIFYVLIFSIGLSLTIVSLGLLLVIGKEKISFDQKLGGFAESYAPIISGLILIVVAARLLL